MWGDMMDTLSRPSGSMSWIQLGAATIFVLVVAVAWRQVTLYITREI
jgi:hypothetical protein